jgi:O-antigen/teichoic acid export membrane protein
MNASGRSSTLLVIRALTYLLGMLTSVLVARSLGSYERGIWAVALLVSGVVSLVSEMGLGVATFSLARQDPNRRAATRTVAIVLALASGSLATGVVLLWIRYGALPIVGNIPPDVLAIALTSVVFTNLLSVTRQSLLEDGDLVGGAASQLVQAAALFALLAILALPGLTTMVAVGMFVASLLIALAFTVVRLHRRGLIRVSWDGALMRPLLGTGLVAHLGTLALFMTFRFDLLLVNRLLGPRAAGLYSVSLSLSEILRGLPEIGQMIVLARSSSSDLVKTVQETTRLAVLATLLAGGGACVAAYWVVPLVFGSEFSGAVVPFVALVPGVVSLAVSYCVSPILVLQGRMRVLAAGSLLSLVSMVALDLAVIPRAGLAGAALVSTLAYTILALVQLLSIQRVQPLTLDQLRPAGADFQRLLKALKQLAARRS